MLDSVPVKPSHLAYQVIEGQAVVLNIPGKTLTGLDPVASRIWQLIDGTRTVREIARAIAEEFEGEEGEIVSDIRAFLKQLLEKNLIGFPTRIAQSLLSFIFLLIFLGYPFIFEAQATVSNNGVMDYGRQANTGMNYVQTYTAPSTSNAEYTDTDTSASAIQFLKSLAAPTREEKFIGHQKADGRLDILTCTTGCDIAGDWTLRGTFTGMSVSATKRGFDIAYEQLSGRAMVVYADNPTTNTAYYCLWDGSAWSPSANCGASFTPGAGNAISLGAIGIPNWVRLISYGDRLTSQRSDEMLLAVSGAAGFAVARWTGSAWTDIVTISTTALATTAIPAMDVAWETVSGRGLVVFDLTAADGTTFYRSYIPGTGWDGANTAGPDTGSGINYWIELGSDPQSNRISMIIGDQESDAHLYIWKSDNSTDGFTTTTTNPIDASIEATSGKVVSTVWSKQNSRALFSYTNANVLTQDVVCWTTGGFTAIGANVGGSNTDDVDNIIVVGSPNNADAFLLRGDILNDLIANRWDGGGCAAGNFTRIPSAGTLAADLLVGVNTAPITFWFSYNPYSPWSRNWRWYADNDATTPVTALAGENIAPTSLLSDQLRLRLQIAEMGGQGQSGAAETKRKKLQYTTANPNSLTTTWTDVAASGTDWIYANCTGCTDDAAVPSTLLTGSTAAGPFVETASTTSSYNHAALAIAEWDYVIQDNVPAGSRGMIYYFRTFDTEQNTSIFRLQRPGDTFIYPEICPRDSIVPWCLDTDVTSLSAPTLDPGVNVYIANNNGDIWAADIDTSNATTDGTQPTGWTNYTDPQDAIQVRLAVIDENPDPKAIYAGSADGCVYKVNASTGATPPIWWRLGGTLPCNNSSERLADQIVASPTYQTIGTTNYVYLATRNTTADVNTSWTDGQNMIWALDASGNCIWVFAASGANPTCTGGTVVNAATAIGIITNMPAVDWDNNCLYFTSRESATSDPTVWALRTAAGGCGSAGNAGTLAWSVDSLGGTNISNVDSAPSLSANNCTLYVGNNTGKLWAINTGSGITGCSGTAGSAKWTGAGYFDADGASNGIYAESIWVQGTALYFSLSSGSVYRVNDPGSGSAPPASAAWSQPVSSPSFPIMVAERNVIYAGSSDGKLHQLCADISTAPCSGTQVDTTRNLESIATVGSPTLDTSSCTGSPVICNVYISTSSGKLYGIKVPY